MRRDLTSVLPSGHSLGVSAEQRVAPHIEHPFEHQHAVLEDADRRARLMHVVKGNALDGELPALGEEEQLDVEAEAVDGLMSHDGARDVAAKALETALRIADTEAEQQLDE